MFLCFGTKTQFSWLLVRVFSLLEFPLSADINRALYGGGMPEGHTTLS